MLIHLEFDHLIAQPGMPLVIPVEVFNDTDVIGGYRIRALGLDQDWVDVVPEELTLFPDTSATAVVTVTVPEALPAGDRILSIEVTQQNTPRHSVIRDVTLSVSPEHTGRSRLEPVSVMGGKDTRYSLTVTNTGNNAVDAGFSWTDEEDKLWMAFDPPYLRLGPGQETTIDIEVTGKRPIFGAPVPRAFTITTEGFDLPEAAHGVFVQKPYLSRGALGLVGLLLGIIVFAGVITASLSRVVDNGRADAQLAVDVLESADRAALAARPGEVTGTVTARAGGQGQPGVAVAAFAADDASTEVATTATDGSGNYRVSGLPPGGYLLRFRAAGFADQWYDGVFTPDDAVAVEVPDGAGVEGIDAALGGTPGSIEGKVVGEEPAGAIIEVSVLLSEDVAFDDAGVPDGADLALFRSVPVAEDGTFVIEDLPSPLHYALTLKKEQFADSVRFVDLGGGEHRDGVVLALRRGDGEIAGSVLDTAGNPLGGATVTATTSTTTFTTLSLTPEAQRGNFALRNLPAPGLYTVTVTLEGYADSTVAVSLGAGEGAAAEPVTVVLDTSRSSITGTVTANGSPLGGVSIVATDGEESFTTISETSGRPGRFLLADLLSPATYSITFSRDGFRSVTRSVATQPGVDPAPLSVTMTPSAGVLQGVVSEIPIGKSKAVPLGNVKVTVSSGSATYVGYSATSSPAGAERSVGFYRIGGIPPGTYSVEFSQAGRQPVVKLATISAAETTPLNATLRAQASIHGRVINTEGAASPNITVRLYISSQFPGTVLATQTTGSDGKYDFRGLDAPEDYIITFARPFEAEETSVSVNGLEQGERRVAPVATVTAGP